MNRSGTTRMWVLVVGLTSLVVALVTAMLKTSVGAPVVETVLSAGVAFGGAFGLGLGILGALQQPRSRSARRAGHGDAVGTDVFGLVTVAAHSGMLVVVVGAVAGPDAPAPASGRKC